GVHVRACQCVQDISEQMDLLVSRGMEVDDSESAIETLRRVNYYRLSGYWYPSRRRTSSGPEDASYPGTRFSDIVALYESGVRLRAATFACWRPWKTAHRRTVELPVPGHKNCPVAATISA